MLSGDLHTYRCIVKMGHLGSGKSSDKAIYVKASSVIEAMRLAKSRGGVKKGHHFKSGASVLNVVRVN